MFTINIKARKWIDAKRIASTQQNEQEKIIDLVHCKSELFFSVRCRHFNVLILMCLCGHTIEHLLLNSFKCAIKLRFSFVSFSSTVFSFVFALLWPFLSFRFALLRFASEFYFWKTKKKVKKMVKWQNSLLFPCLLNHWASLTCTEKRENIKRNSFVWFVQNSFSVAYSA